VTFSLDQKKSSSIVGGATTYFLSVPIEVVKKKIVQFSNAIDVVHCIVVKI
jgi:hypothetical protein